MNLEKSLSIDINELRNRVNSVTLQSGRSSYGNPMKQQIQNNIDNQSRNLKIDYQENNIQSLAEKLHEKLNQKEQKVNLLQQQTNTYINNTGRRVFTPNKY